MKQRKSELLDVPYSHVVFTLPARIAAIAYQNKAVVSVSVQGFLADNAHDAAIPSTWASRSASPRCSTPGARHELITHTST